MVCRFEPRVSGFDVQIVILGINLGYQTGAQSDVGMREGTDLPTLVKTGLQPGNVARTVAIIERPQG